MSNTKWQVLVCNCAVDSCLKLLSLFLSIRSEKIRLYSQFGQAVVPAQIWAEYLLIIPLPFLEVYEGYCYALWSSYLFVDYFLCHKSKHSSQHPVLGHSRSVSVLVKLVQDRMTASRLDVLCESLWPILVNDIPQDFTPLLESTATLETCIAWQRCGQKFTSPAVALLRDFTFSSLGVRGT